MLFNICSKILKSICYVRLSERMHRYNENYCDACRRNNFYYIDAYVRITVIKSTQTA